MTNPPCGGIYPLREAIAKYLKEFRGMTVLPEQIIIGAGTEYLYGLLIQLLGTDKDLRGRKSRLPQDRKDISELEGSL